MVQWLGCSCSLIQVPSVAPIPYQPRLFGFRIHNRHSIIKIKLENVSMLLIERSALACIHCNVVQWVVFPGGVYVFNVCSFRASMAAATCLIRSGPQLPP